MHQCSMEVKDGKGELEKYAVASLESEACGDHIVGKEGPG